MNLYKNMFTQRPFLKEIEWQKQGLFDEDIKNKSKVVLAAGTSSGKTWFITMLLNLFYMDSNNSKKKTLVIPSSQTNLRSNFEDVVETFKPDFTYKVCTSCNELRDALNSDIQVIICLPQTIARCLDSLPKLDKLILDEAHTWYFKKTLRSIVKKTKPIQQLLLTGTPSPFILRGGFHMHYVPVMDLYDEGLISNPEIHVVSSTYDFKEEDYQYSGELIKSSANKKALSSEESLRKVILGMIRKLKNPIKGTKNLNRLTNDVGGRFFNYLDKTIIWVSSIKQADKFAQVLRTFKGMQNAVLVSHSENDQDSLLMEKFKNDPDIKVLVSVNRGRLGWSYTELFNGIDFTMTRNLNTILQMLARLFRLSDNQPNKRKFFFKVSNFKDAGYFTVIMKGVLLLLDRKWYSTYNGKNFNGMEIPVTVPRRRNPGPNNTTSGRPRKNYRFEMLDIPLDLNFFKTVYAKQDDKFSTVAWTTIGKVRETLGNFTIPNKQRTVESVMEELKQYKTYKDLVNNNSAILAWMRLHGKLDMIYNYYDYVPRSDRSKKIEKYWKISKQFSVRKDIPNKISGYLLKYDRDNWFKYWNPENRKANAVRVKAINLKTGQETFYNYYHEAKDAFKGIVGSNTMTDILKERKDSWNGYTFKYVQ